MSKSRERRNAVVKEANPESAGPWIRRALQKASAARFYFWGHARAWLLRSAPHVWFTRVGRGTRFFGWPRVQYWGGPITIGERCIFGKDVFFLVARGGEIVIADDVSVNDYCFLTSQSRIEIEEGAAIAEMVSIRDYDHEFDGARSVHELGYTTAPIRIGRSAWIGRGVMITKGVTIGEGAVVGANSVVTKDVPPHCVAVGAPARVVRELGPAGRSDVSRAEAP
jgi:acetyltransferase-like isoleucine patch superfamily enzyme